MSGRKSQRQKAEKGKEAASQGQKSSLTDVDRVPVWQQSADSSDQPVVTHEQESVQVETTVEPGSEVFPGSANVTAEGQGGLVDDIAPDLAAFPGGASWLTVPAFPGGNNATGGGLPARHADEAFPGGLNLSSTGQAVTTPSESPPDGRTVHAPANQSSDEESSDTAGKSAEVKRQSRRKKRK